MTYEFSPWLICAVFSLTGGALGAVFDLYRVVRYFSRPGRWLTALGDILYWTMVTGVIFGLLSVAVNGELRFYFFLFLLFGLGIYYCWFSRTLLRVYRALGRWLLAGLRAIYRGISKVVEVLLAPVVWLGRIILTPLKWLLVPFAFLGRTLKRWLQPPPPTSE